MTEKASMNSYDQTGRTALRMRVTSLHELSEDERRQAWYEFALKVSQHVDLGNTIDDKMVRGIIWELEDLYGSNHLVR